MTLLRDTILRDTMGAAAILGLAMLGSIPGGLLAGAEARAEYPKFSGEFSVEVENDWVTESDDPGAETNEAFATIEPAFTVEFSSMFSLNAAFTFEPVRDPDPFEDRVFEDHGLYVSDLFFSYARGNARIDAGKIGAPFGRAWDAAPGIWGVDFAEDYELAERIGIGAAITFGGGAEGRHTLSGATFFADTTFMSESLFTNRGRTRISDGGASNTEDFASFSIALDGGEIAAVPGLGYHISFRHQGAGQGDADDDSGFAFALSHESSVADWQLALLGEFATFDNFDGGGADVDYWTFAAELSRGKLALALVYSIRDTAPTPAGGDDEQVQLSVGYALRDDITLEAGWRYLDEASTESHTLGLRLTFTGQI